METVKDESSELSVPELIVVKEPTPPSPPVVHGPLQRFTHLLTRWGVETNGYDSLIDTA